MKNSHLLLPALSALALILAPATSFADRRITVYRDRDGDGHFNRKRIEIPRHRFQRGAPFCGPRGVGLRGPFFGPGFGPGFGAGFGPGFGYRPFGSVFGPAVGFSVARGFRTPVYANGCSDDLASDVQRELRRRGYYRGWIDGDVGPGTRGAIRAYQYDRGLAVTGRIDRSLLRSLGLG